jgi:hypothetical protein
MAARIAARLLLDNLAINYPAPLRAELKRGAGEASSASA